MGSSTTSTSTCCCADRALVTKAGVSHTEPQPGMLVAHVGAVVADVGYGGVNIIDAKDSVSSNTNDRDSDSDKDYIKDPGPTSDDSELDDPSVVEGRPKSNPAELGLSGSKDSSSIPLYVKHLALYTELELDGND